MRTLMRLRRALQGHYFTVRSRGLREGDAVGQSCCPMSGYKIGLYKKNKSGNIEFGD